MFFLFMDYHAIILLVQPTQDRTALFVASELKATENFPLSLAERCGLTSGEYELPIKCV